MSEVNEEAIRQAIANLKIDGIYVEDKKIEEYKRRKTEKEKVKKR